MDRFVNGCEGFTEAARQQPPLLTWPIHNLTVIESAKPRGSGAILTFFAFLIHNGVSTFRWRIKVE